MTTVLLVANLTFISAAYYISQEAMAPQALQTIGRLISSANLNERALYSPNEARALLKELRSYGPLRAAALYDNNGERLEQMHQGESLELPRHFKDLDNWRLTEFRSTQVITVPKGDEPPGHLLLVASSEYTGTLTASLGILVFSVLLWLVVARQIRRLITEPIYQLEELSRRVTREENYALRAEPGNEDEIGSLAEAFNTMLSRIEARAIRRRGWPRKPAIPTASWNWKFRCAARSRKSSPASRITSTASSIPCPRP